MRAQRRSGESRGQGVPDPGSFTIWAKNVKAVDRWLPIITGLRGQAATDELIVRQDRVRRSGEACVFKLLPEGEIPEK